METTSKLMLGYYPKADKTYSLNIRLTHNRKSTFVPLNISILKDDYDENNKEIKKSCKQYKEIRKVNAYIKNKIAELNSLINELYDSGDIETMSANDIKKRFLNKTDRLTFGQYATKLIDEYTQANRLGNAAIYEQVKSLVIKFNGNNDIQFANINYSFLKEFEIDHLKRGNQYNSLSVYMRTIRAIYNKAIKENIAKPEWYPFNQYSIKNSNTEKRAIKKEDILAIEKLKVKKTSPEFHAKNFFLFSFYMVGLNFTDMAFLTKENFDNDRLQYKRRKTGKIYSLQMNQKAVKIYNYYRRVNQKSKYIFPIIQREEPSDQRKDIRNGLKLYNKYLQEIAKELKIIKKLTSYVPRHTWASTAKDHAPVQLISEALGHSRISTTQTYLDSFDDASIDKLNEIVTL